MSKDQNENANTPAAIGSGSEGKRRPGRPSKKENAVYKKDHRLSVFINQDIFEFWTDRNKKTNSTMASVINTLLYDEMERIKKG